MADHFPHHAGHGLGGPFLNQKFEHVLHVINTNITGTIHVVQHVARGMVARGRGRILITGSIAGFQPGSFHAVYNASKAFIDSFSIALRNELQGTDVTVSCLMPGPTDTEFFERAHMETTALASLQRAIELDPVNRADAQADDDFEPIRELPAFQQLVGAAP